MKNMIKTDSNLKLYPNPQKVVFGDKEDHNSVGLLSSDVIITPSSGEHDRTSSRVQIKNIIDYAWQPNYYVGQLLAVHMSRIYLAYGIKGTSNGVLRVINTEKELRVLLRGMRGTIQDLAFAHVSDILLACIDCSGSLFVHRIECMPTELIGSLLLKVEANDDVTLAHRVIWCPYIPEEDSSDGDEVSKLLVLTRGSSAELWFVGNVSSKFRHVEATNEAIRKSGGMLEINQHTQTIVEAALSPDGTALATASLDGEVKFFQVCLPSDENHIKPRCLHQWKPHDGRPVSCLFFLDDHKNYESNAQFWKFAITGCNSNSEIKVWSCELWTCLQTIQFSPIPSTRMGPILKAGIDLSASYLLLSDICNRVLYILSISKNSNVAHAYISTVSEFRLFYSILSFAIVDAGQKKIRPTGESLEDLSPCDEESEDQFAILMYLVNIKSLQECHIAFKLDTQVHNSLTKSMNFTEDLPNIATINHNGISKENCEEDHSLSTSLEAVNNHNAGLNLMTPDAFSSPAKKENNEDSNSGSFELGKATVSPSLGQMVQAMNISEVPLEIGELEEQTPASGGSSPSREVREILSLTGIEDEVETEDKLEPKTVSKEDWPNPPRVILKDMPESKEFTNDSNIQAVARKLSSDDVAMKIANENQEKANRQYITDLKIKMESMLEIIQDQRQELRDLRAEVTRLRQDTPISTQIEAVLKVAEQQNTHLEETLLGHLTRQHAFLDAIDMTIKEKMEKVLPRIVEASLEPLKHQLRLDATRMDEVFKENLTKTITSVPMKDTLAIAAANAAGPALDIAFKETFAKVVLPGMEKICQTMFQQLQDTFIRGTREYLRNVDAITENQNQRRNDRHGETLANVVRDGIQHELNAGITNLREGTLRTIRDSVRDNLNQQFGEFAGVRSRAATPAIPPTTSADAQAKIVSLLQRGQLNAAFQQALSASDLNLVVLVCEETEPSRVFNSPLPIGQGTRCILPQPVILSLVQQLSADLGHRTELKHRWLEEAILNLDPNDPVTREHIGNVLMTLQNQLAAFVAANPNHQSLRRMKMLGMATRSLLSQRP